MKVNHKQMFALLKQQVKVLQNQINPAAASESVNQIPENFNQAGWDTTIEKVELMLSKMKALREVKGKRLTPQFYRSIYNRALIANNEIDKLHEALTSTDDNIDFESECVKLTAQIHELNIRVAELAAQKAEQEAAEAKIALNAEYGKQAAQAAQAEQAQTEKDNKRNK